MLVLCSKPKDYSSKPPSFLGNSNRHLFSKNMWNCMRTYHMDFKNLKNSGKYRVRIKTGIPENFKNCQYPYRMCNVKLPHLSFETVPRSEHILIQYCKINLQQIFNFLFLELANQNDVS